MTLLIKVAKTLACVGDQDTSPLITLSAISRCFVTLFAIFARISLTRWGESAITPAAVSIAIFVLRPGFRFSLIASDISFFCSLVMRGKGGRQRVDAKAGRRIPAPMCVLGRILVKLAHRNAVTR